jgi:hypothetical protein
MLWIPLVICRAQEVQHYEMVNLPEHYATIQERIMEDLHLDSEPHRQRDHELPDLQYLHLHKTSIHRVPHILDDPLDLYLMHPSPDRLPHRTGLSRHLRLQALRLSLIPKEL